MREFLMEVLNFCIEVAIAYAFGHLVAEIIVRKIKKELFKED